MATRKPRTAAESGAELHAKAAALPADFKMPKSLGAAIDDLYKRREKRYELQRIVAQMSNAESALRDYIINTLPKSEATGAAGKVARAQVTTKIVPTIADFDELWKFAKRTNSPELFQRRLSAAAVQERWEAGKTVPGVGKFNAIDVSITKI